MDLSFKHTQGLRELSNHFYDYLPASGDASWKGHVSFRTIAEKVGVGSFWQPGSKRPMIEALFSRTLCEKRHLFQRLVLETVSAGITYRQKQRNPVTPDDIDVLNGILLALGFKFPELWDPEFKDVLRMDSAARAKKLVRDAVAEDDLKATSQQARSNGLAELQTTFFELASESDRWKAGLALEKLLNRLFALEGLAPREPFKLVGEQIDGSFELDHETYLVEAKWEKGPLPEGPLLVFRGKIEGKSAHTRGVFIALNGISKEAREAIVQGKQPTFFVIDGHDLTMVLGDQIPLKHFLRQRRRVLAEEGQLVVPFAELWKGSRA